MGGGEQEEKVVNGVACCLEVKECQVGNVS